MKQARREILTTLAIVGMTGWLFCFPPMSVATGIPAPEITSQTWLNSEPLKLENLRGKVVMVEFWTFGPLDAGTAGTSSPMSKNGTRNMPPKASS